jgi:hypothetical protein
MAAQEAVNAPGDTRATAFGLSVSADRSLAFLQGSKAASTGRPLELCVAEREELTLGWPSSSEVICSQRDSQGAESFSIQTHRDAGYRIWGRGRGAFFLSCDGRHLRCAPDDPDDATWERFLVGQVLPFAALVAGLEIFHAGCVCLGGKAIALAGPSGAGKTSVALELCARGASFLADDVIALEAREETLLVNPGTAVVGIDLRDAPALILRGELSQAQVLLGNPREQVLRVQGGCEPAPLGALFLLDRRRDGPCHPRFEHVADPRVLLGATFNFALATPERLLGLLHVCALASRQRVERIVSGAEVDASQLAAAIERRLEGSP